MDIQLSPVALALLRHRLATKEEPHHHVRSAHHHESRGIYANLWRTVGVHARPWTLL
jgi:hypothetical protein